MLKASEVQVSKVSQHNCTLLHKSVLSVTLYNIVYKVVTKSLLSVDSN